VGGRIRDRVDAIATLARPDTEAGPDSSADIDLTLPGGRRLTGTVAGIRAGARLRVSFSSLGAKARLSSWVDLLALSAAWPEENWRSVTVARRKDSGTRHVLARVDQELALGALAELVAVRDEGLREPLPMPLKTTCAYTEIRNRGAGESIGRAARAAAEKEWDGGRFPGERDDAEHRLVWGPEAPFDVLDLARLHSLAGRVWRPLLQAEAAS
jgi:exodeoxyribonuclease V gamma subunit